MEIMKLAQHSYENNKFNVIENIEGMSERIESLHSDNELDQLSKDWITKVGGHDYAHNFTWLGRPIIQVPQDIVAMQELIWKVNPDLIIETGIALGGSLILSASMIALLDLCEVINKGSTLRPSESMRKVVGIDIDIRAHNRASIKAHPMASRIELLEGSSIAPNIVESVRTLVKNYKNVLVCLDSMHTHDHVLAELEIYAPLVSENSYCVVFDTFIEDLPDDMSQVRPWGKGNNPKTAVWEYLRRLKDEGRKGQDGKPLHFVIDKDIEHKLSITAAPDGYLKRVE
jgi:cephalosporin hydroxylase